MKAFTLITELDNPVVLFKLKTASVDLSNRSLYDTILLFLSLHEYEPNTIERSEFDSTVVNMFKLAVGSKTVSDMRTRVLLWTMYAMMLSRRGDWEFLEEALQKLCAEAEPKCIATSDKSLSLFCEGVKYYAQAALKAHQKHVDTGSICNKAVNKMKCFQETHGLLETNIVRLYFTGHIELLKARAHYERKGSPWNKLAQEAIDLCKKVTKHTDIRSVEPVMLK